jgi:VanZ family protein
LWGLGYGLLIEFVQHFLPYRSASLGDLLADAAGMAIGSALVCLAVIAARRRFPGGRVAAIKLF